MRSMCVAARAALLAGLFFGLGADGSTGHFGLSAASAQEAQWIWSPADDGQGTSPAGTCFFRRAFDLNQPEAGEVQITADEGYELYVNSHKVGDGKNWHVMDIHDITKYLVAGRNVVAVKVSKSGTGPAGMAARVLVKSVGDTYVGYFSNGNWKTSQKLFEQWTLVRFNDAQWLPARVIGQFGVVKPWLDEVQLAGGNVSGRFTTGKDFRVEPVAAPQETGSLLTMAFNEFGEILAAREAGPLLLLRSTKKGGLPDKASVYCDQVKNIQGILPLNGQVFVVGAGSDGAGLYRISDDDENKAGDKSNDASGDKSDKSPKGDTKSNDKPAPSRHADLLIKFTGEMSEHGPHVPLLGPDGLIYVLIGDHTKPDKADDPASPHHHYYEGDLVTPRYEDPNGYGVGVKAPAGQILRTDTTGSFIESFAGGFRNPYGFAFNKNGELFTHESDMEWDVGLPWYRPTRVLHVVPGGEYGWRSGWAAWPKYFFDALPSVVDTGRGSPTGMVAYNHVMYPKRYHDSLFVGDWSRGRILNIRLKPSGAGYTATSNVFLEGKPLNVTGLAVGPDGWLYFCTGGRDTEGGVYRVVWNGRVPDEAIRLGDGFEAAIRQPQLDSAYARQKIATIKQRLGDRWDKQIGELVERPTAEVDARCRALDLMQLVGPFPTSAQLLRLSRDPESRVRAKVAFLMGLHADDSTQARLVDLLHDTDGLVARLACEALVRAGHKATWGQLAPLLKSADHYVAWAATRALERVPHGDWQDKALKTDDPRLFVQGRWPCWSLNRIVRPPRRFLSERRACWRVI